MLFNSININTMNKFDNKLPVYMVDGLDSEITAISLVSEPAIMESFVSFSKDRKMHMFMNEEKMQVMGPVLIPNQKIYRNSEGYEYYIVFSKEAIEQLSRKFLTELRNNQWSIQHEEPTDSVSIIESWTKSDIEYDKSNAFGFMLPVGTWFCTAQINDIDLWQKIKRGDMTGFSIEAWLNLDEIINKNNFNKMDNKDEKMNKFMDAFRSFLSDFLVKEDEVEMNAEEQPQAEAETPEVEPESAEEEKIEETQEEVQEEPENELVIDESAPAIEDSEEQKLSSVIADLEEKLKQLEQENSSLQDKVENLSKQPSAEPVNVNAKQVSNRDFLKQIANKF